MTNPTLALLLFSNVFFCAAIPVPSNSSTSSDGVSTKEIADSFIEKLHITRGGSSGTGGVGGAGGGSSSSSSGSFGSGLGAGAAGGALAGGHFGSTHSSSGSSGSLHPGYFTFLSLAVLLL